MSPIGTHEEKRRVAIYIRVSTQEQKMEGYGLEAQEKRLTEYIEKNEGLRLETKKQWLYIDVHTGSDLNRDGLNRLRDDVRAGKFDAVLVWKIDRLSRNLKHLLTIFEEFQKNHVSFISIQENIDFRGPIGNLIFQIFGAIAEFERELIKGRTQMGRITSAEMGNFTGTNIPYGYSKVPNESGKGSKLKLIPEEKKWVEQIYNWYIFEDMGDGQIATRLNELKVPKTNHKRTSRASMEWTHIMVRTILTNHLYRGEFVANRTDEMNNILPEDQWTLVAIPACVSEFRFLQAQEARKQRVSNIAGTDYLLSGKLVDMDLEKPKKFVGAKRFKGGFSYRRKQFNKGGKHYSVFEIAGQQMEDFVWNKICEALRNPKAFVKNYVRRERADPKRIDMFQDQLKTLRKRKAENEGAIDRIEKAYEEGGYSQEKMEEKVAERNREIVEIEMKVQEIEDQLSMISGHEIQIQKLEQISKETKDSVETSDRKQKKMMCQLLIERVEMRRRKVHGHWKTHGEVIFHFNPQKFEREIEVGRTSKSLPSAERGRLKDKNDFIGGR